MCRLASQEGLFSFKLVFYLCRKYCFGQCVSAAGELCISQSGLDTFFFMFPECFKIC